MSNAKPVNVIQDEDDSYYTLNKNREVEKIHDKKKSHRLMTIDYMKGFSMILIFALHIGSAWKTPQDTGLIKLLFMMFDFFGPSMFVTLSVIGSMIGYYHKEKKGDRRLMSTHLLLKSSYLFIIGELFNLFSSSTTFGIFHVLSFNVVTLVGVITLLMPAIIRLNYKVKIVLILALMLSYYPLYNWTFQGLVAVGTTEAGIHVQYFGDPRVFLFFLFFNPNTITPLFSWMMVPLFASLIFNGFIKAQVYEKNESLYPELKKILLAGLLILLGSLVFGLAPIYMEDLMGQLRAPGSLFQWPLDAGVPPIWIRNTPQYLFYNFGIFTILFFLLGRWEIHLKKPFLIEEKICIFGVLSLTGFLASFIGTVIPIEMPLYVFGLIFIPICIGLIYCFSFWGLKLKGTGTFEWLMVVYIAGLKKVRNMIWRRERK